MRLFADDTALYLTMEGKDDSKALQNDLDILSTWETKWDMAFNPSKCQVVHVTGSKSKRPIKTDYILHGQVLESVTCARYLGVDISSDLTWNSHVDRITGNANRTLGFIRRNIKTKMPRVRETAYNTLVRPQLEYASAVWDPNTDKLIRQIDQVQRRAARWTVNNFCRQASVTEIIENLGWRTLEQRRADARLCLFYKVVHGLVAVPLQGRRRLLKSGPAMKAQRWRSRVPKVRVGGEHERGRSPSRKGGSGDLPRENFIFPDVCRNDFNAL